MATPGDDAPYTHREIFFDSSNKVGLGLDTFSGVDSETLRDQSTISDVVGTDKALIDARKDQYAFVEQVRSEVVMDLARSEYVVEWLAKNTSDIQEENYITTEELLTLSDVGGISDESKEFLLSIEYIHDTLYDDDDLLSDLFINHSSWISYYRNLTTNGNIIEDGKLTEEAIKEMAMYAIDEHGNDPFTVLSTQSNRDDLLINSNNLSDDSLIDVSESHPGLIVNKDNSYNSYDVTPWSTDEWRSSDYNNSIPIRLLRESIDLRRYIAAHELSTDDENFMFSDVFDGTYLDNFWEYEFNEEFIKDAASEYTSNTDGFGDNETIAIASTTVNSNIVLYGEGSATVDEFDNETGVTAVAEANIDTQEFDVSDYTQVEFVIDSGNSYTESDSASTSNYDLSASSSVTVSAGESSKEWSGGDTPDDHAFDISDDEFITVYFQAIGSADARYDEGGDEGASATADAKVDITDVVLS